MIGEPFERSKQRAFDDEREREHRHSDAPLIGLRSLAIVDEPPESAKQLLAEDAREQAGGDAKWHEDQLGHLSVGYPRSTGVKQVSRQRSRSRGLR